MGRPKNKGERRKKAKVKGIRRAKNITSKFYDFQSPQEDKQEELKKFARHHRNTTARCSCSMCGNPRKHFDERTIQEKRNNIK